MQASIANLPSDCLFYLISYLRSPAILECTLVCKHWHRSISKNTDLYLTIHNDLFTISDTVEKHGDVTPNQLWLLPSLKTAQRSYKLQSTECGVMGLHSAYQYRHNSYERQFYLKSDQIERRQMNVTKNRGRLVVTRSQMNDLKKKMDVAIAVYRQNKGLAGRQTVHLNQFILRHVYRKVQVHRFMNDKYLTAEFACSRNRNEIEHITDLMDDFLIACDIVPFNPDGTPYVRKAKPLRVALQPYQNQHEAIGQSRIDRNNELKDKINQIEMFRLIFDRRLLGQGEGTDVAEWLQQYGAYFPRIKALAIWDYRGCEDVQISWSFWKGLSAVLNELPNLLHLRIKGRPEHHAHEFGPHIKHEKLLTFVMVTGGMSSEMFHSILQCDFPALCHLELWLGRLQYGCTVTTEDFNTLLSPTENGMYPMLTYLGLRNFDRSDNISFINQLGASNILRRIEILDLSNGVVDNTAASLLLDALEKDSSAFEHLKIIDLHGCFIDDETVIQRLSNSNYLVDLLAVARGINRYCAVGE